MTRHDEYEIHRIGQGLVALLLIGILVSGFQHANDIYRSGAKRKGNNQYLVQGGHLSQRLEHFVLEHPELSITQTQAFDHGMVITAIKH